MFLLLLLCVLRRGQVLCSSATRAAEALQELRRAGARSTAKLWARHLRAEEQRAALAQRFVGVAAGTPGRVRQLWEEESFAPSHTQLLVLDCRPDANGHTLFSAPDSAAELLPLLLLCLKRLHKGKLKIACC